jgi:hypothetical protein
MNVTIVLSVLSVATMFLFIRSVRNGTEYKTSFNWGDLKNNPYLEQLRIKYNLDTIFIDAMPFNGPTEEVLVYTSRHGIRHSKQQCIRMDWKYKGITFFAYLNKFQKVEWVSSYYGLNGLPEQRVFDDLDRQWEQVNSLIKESVEKIDAAERDNTTHLLLQSFN